MATVGQQRPPDPRFRLSGYTARSDAGFFYGQRWDRYVAEPAKPREGRRPSDLVFITMRIMRGQILAD